MRYYGHRSDPESAPREYGAHVGALLRAGSHGPPSASLKSATFAGPGVLDQSISSACVGHAIVGAIETHLAATGKPVPHHSPFCVYDWARCEERVQEMPPGLPLPALLDTGSMPSLAMRGVTQFGVCLYERRPTDPGAVNDEPELAQFEDAAAFALLGWSRIDATGTERVTQMRAAIAAGYPVCRAIQCDEVFEEYRGGILGAPSSPILGGHYIYDVAYTTFNGSTVFESANSWGLRWGEDGFFRSSEAAIQASSDIYVMAVRRIES